MKAESPTKVFAPVAATHCNELNMHTECIINFCVLYELSYGRKV